MFDKIIQAAEHAATNVSRRQFLGKLGRAAMVLAAAAAGVLALPTTAEARQRVCWANSQVEQCRGQALGSACVAGNNRPGRCVSDGNIQIAPGVYDCNYCKPSGRPR